MNYLEHTKMDRSQLRNVHLFAMSIMGFIWVTEYLKGKFILPYYVVMGMGE